LKGTKILPGLSEELLKHAPMFALTATDKAWDWKVTAQGVFIRLAGQTDFSYWRAQDCTDAVLKQLRAQLPKLKEEAPAIYRQACDAIAPKLMMRRLRGESTGSYQEAFNDMMEGLLNSIAQQIRTLKLAIPDDFHLNHRRVFQKMEGRVKVPTGTLDLSVDRTRASVRWGSSNVYSDTSPNYWALYECLDEALAQMAEWLAITKRIATPLD